MRLNLALNGILVASATLDPTRCKDEYYLQAMRRQLLQQNGDILSLIPAKPVYYIEVPAASASLLFNKKEEGYEHEELHVSINNYQTIFNLGKQANFSTN